MNDSPYLSHVQPVSAAGIAAARERQRRLAGPDGGLGRLEELGNRVAAIQGLDRPAVAGKRIYVVAADHGLPEEASGEAFSGECDGAQRADSDGTRARCPTRRLVELCAEGRSALAVAARSAGIDVRVVDAGVAGELSCPVIDRRVGNGTADMTEGPALTSEQAAQAVATGIELACLAGIEGVGLLGLGSLGPGGSTSAAAITSALTGRLPRYVTGCGTGADVERKVRLVERALQVNQPMREDPMDILEKVGGADIAVLVGMFIGAASARLPVVADGFATTAAAALAVARCAAVKDYLFVAQRSREPGHSVLLTWLGIEPILDLQMTLGEGVGAALAIPIIEASVRLLSEMAEWDEL